MWYVYLSPSKNNMIFDTFGPFETSVDAHDWMTENHISYDPTIVPSVFRKGHEILFYNEMADALPEDYDPVACGLHQILI